MTDFEKLVLEMRKAQKNFFKTRDRKYLDLSKKLESEVDRCLSNKLNPNLFDE